MDGQQKGLVFHKLEGYLLCVEGLRIGGSKEEGDIGGADNPIIRHPITKRPYIPGSSIKGKIRSLLETYYDVWSRHLEPLESKLKELKDKGEKSGKQKDEVSENEIKKKEGEIRAVRESPCSCALPECEVCTLFGPHMKPTHDLGPARLIFRDCQIVDTLSISEELKKKMKESCPSPLAFDKLQKLWEEEGIRYVETKPENIINRRVGTSKDFRQMERIPAGTVFEFELVFVERKGDEAQMPKWKNIIREGIRLLEKSYLGGCGSRGYGKVKFVGLKFDGDPFLSEEKQCLSSE